MTFVCPAATVPAESSTGLWGDEWVSPASNCAQTITFSAGAALAFVTATRNGIASPASAIGGESTTR